MPDPETRIAAALEMVAEFQAFRPREAVTRHFLVRLRAALSPPPKEYVFGGVRFVETGEVRAARVGDWFLWSGGQGVTLRVDQGAMCFDGGERILKPVGVVDE